MSLTTNPFHPATGDLLPVFRDAYLRGDLSAQNTELVDAYLKANPTEGTEAFHRFHALQSKGHSVRPVGWLDKQFELLRTEPQRFRRRAGSLVLVGALISGAVFASNGHLATSGGILKTAAPVTASTLAAAEAAALSPEATSALTTTTINGRILNEKGQPLVGATVLDKLSHRGVSTDAQGRYAFAVPRAQHVQLQFGYGGYQDADVQAQGQSLGDVTLQPRTDLPKKRWWHIF